MRVGMVVAVENEWEGSGVVSLLLECEVFLS